MEDIYGKRTAKARMMVDVTAKTNSLRTAVATASVHVGSKASIEAIRNGEVPKGDVLEASRVAGLFGVKRTSDMIPDCHPMPIEHAEVEHELEADRILVRMRVASIYRTGVEVEAMHGASVVALTIYDMLKPIDKGVGIGSIELEEKRGGKSDFEDPYKEDARAGVVVCSDTVAAGKKEDRAGKAVKEELEGHRVQVEHENCIPDEAEEIRKQVEEAEENGLELLIFSGGTGLSPRDRTPETLQPLLDREIPGIGEAMRSYGQERTPYSMLSRSLAGVKGRMLVLALPGSKGGARDSVRAVFPFVLHLFRILKGKRHE
jgi:molybdenum cofactor biosynthesis protein MoaC